MSVESAGDPIYPCLRPGLSAGQDGDARHVVLFDQLRIAREPLRLTAWEFNCIRLFNGRRSLRDVQAEAVRLMSGLLIPIESIETLFRRLDEHLFLDNDRFRDYLTGPDREASCIGCYPAEPAMIRQLFRSLFTGQGGPGLPGEPGCRIGAEGRIRAALVPHIDFGRGGVTYGWGFKEIIERTDASLFVVIATSHYSPERFTLTRKNFKTPLGCVPTDQGYIDRLEKHYGNGLFDDPIAHLPEHSIELEVVLLQYLLEGRKPFRIVPLLTGSFGDCVEGNRDPSQCDDVKRLVESLQKVEQEMNEPICYLISGDLAHIGPKFDDPEPVDESLLSESLAQDHAILKQAEAVSPEGYFGVIAAEGDRRRICGLPPTWTTLAAVKPERGKLLHYGRYVHPQGFESVSFASMVFE
jgi:MEMO1 family protein